MSRARMGWLSVLLLLLGVLGWSPVRAEDESSTNTEAAVERSLRNSRSDGQLPLAGPIDATTYFVGPGDLLVLQFTGEVTRSMPLEVDPEGQLFLPGVGAWSAAGRTLAEVRTEVLRRMRPQYRNVALDLRLGRMRTFRVHLTGEVRVPGPVTVNGSMRVADILRAESLVEGASTRRIEVLRREGGAEPCDLELLVRAGDGSRNPVLRDGDIVHVPRATAFLHAEGAVAHPGRFELGVDDSLLTLFRLAGQPLPSALVDSVMLVRFRNPVVSETLWVDLESVYARTRNPALGDGSRLYVHFSPRYNEQHQAGVYGEVVRPGVYPIREGVTRLSDLMKSANGFLRGSEKSSIRVHRRSSAASEKDPELERLLRLSRNELTASEYEVLRTKLAGLREDYRLDWERLQTDSDLDLLLRDGDIVRVEREVLSIRVDGEVRRPGIVNFVPGGDVERYISEAGGYTSRAWRGKVRVTRAVTGQTLLAHNVRTLDAGDFIWVPERNDLTGWEQATRLLSSLAQIATIVIAIRTVR